MTHKNPIKSIYVGMAITIGCLFLFACNLKHSANIEPSLPLKIENAINKDRGEIENKSSEFENKGDIEKLKGLLAKKQYADLFRDAAQLLNQAQSSQTYFSVYTLLSKAHFDLGEDKDALLFMVSAYETGTTDERDQLLSLLKPDLTRVKTKAFDVALSHVDQAEVKADLIYQFAQLKYDNKEYNDAKHYLSVLIESASLHGKTALAKELLARIDQITGLNLKRIGCLLPLSGPYQTYGTKALNGIIYALEEYNRQNPDTRFELKVMDTGTAQVAISRLIAELDEKKVALIIGPISNGLEAAVEAQKRNMPIITLSQKDGICDIGDYVFRHFITASMQVEAIMSSATKQFGVRRFAVFHPDEPYGRKFAELFENAASRHGVSVEKVISYEPGQTDFGEHIQRMVRYAEVSVDKNRRTRRSPRHREKDPILEFEAIFIPDSSRMISMIAPQLDFYDVNGALLFGTNLWHSDELIKLSGKYVQEAVLPAIFFSNSSDESVRQFVSEYQSHFDEQPGFMEAVAYDTVKIAFRVLSEPGLASRDDIKFALRNMAPHNGITGWTRFDDRGEAQKNLFLLQIVGDGFVEIENPENIYSFLMN